jgi:hypothetical protein
VVRQGERFDLVSVMSVDWIEAANNYAVLHCGAVDHVFGETLASLETRLDPAKFLRVHRSMIVNTARIVTVHTMIGGVYELELRGGTRVKTGGSTATKSASYLACVTPTVCTVGEGWRGLSGEVSPRETTADPVILAARLLLNVVRHVPEPVRQK